jgi:hypothetical protein
VLTTGTASVSAAGSELGVFGTTYGTRQDGSVLSVPITVAAGGATSSVTTVITTADGALSLSSGSYHGLPTLRVTVGSSSQRFVLAASGFPS